MTSISVRIEGASSNLVIKSKEINVISASILGIEATGSRRKIIPDILVSFALLLRIPR